MTSRFRQSLAAALKTVVLLHTLMATLFALFSGAGSAGFWANLPNALPWLLALLLSLAAWRWPRAAGLGLILWALGACVFFTAWNNPIVLGLFLAPPAGLGWIIWQSAERP